MHAVVSLLDKKNDRVVRLLWEELERTFHARGVYKTPYPHFSYQIASDYDFSRLETKLEKFAKGSHGFSVRATGLGVFTGRRPVLYIPVVRSLGLSQFHRTLCRRISSIGSGVPPYYETDRWMPHITLAQWDVDHRNLPEIFGKLGEMTLEMDIKVDNLAIILDDGTSQKVRSKYYFSARRG